MYSQRADLLQGNMLPWDASKNQEQTNQCPREPGEGLDALRNKTKAWDVESLDAHKIGIVELDVLGELIGISLEGVGSNQTVHNERTGWGAVDYHITYASVGRSLAHVGKN